MLIVGRRLLGRVSKAYDEVGQVPVLWLGMIFVGVLLSAYVAQVIGIAAIFGSFVMGLIMPRRAGLTEDVSRRFENFVVLVLLPLFFVVTGLRTEVGSLNRPILWAADGRSDLRRDRGQVPRRDGRGATHVASSCATRPRSAR